MRINHITEAGRRHYSFLRNILEYIGIFQYGLLMRWFAVVILGQALQKIREIEGSSPADYKILKAWVADFQQRGLPLTPAIQKIRAFPTKYILTCEVDLDQITRIIDISIFEIEEE
jgi:hypothetical protein